MIDYPTQISCIYMYIIYVKNNLSFTSKSSRYYSKIFTDKRENKTRNYKFQFKFGKFTTNKKISKTHLNHYLKKGNCNRKGVELELKIKTSRLFATFICFGVLWIVSLRFNVIIEIWRIISVKRILSIIIYYLHNFLYNKQFKNILYQFKLVYTTF